MNSAAKKQQSVTVDYQTHFKEFSQSVAYAARTWHYNLYLNAKAEDGSVLSKALNMAPRYWLDQRYNALQATVIVLGKIFDEGDYGDSQVFNIDRLRQALYESKQHFSKQALRQRKVEMAEEFEGLDEYIQSKSELDDADIKTIATEIKKAKRLWVKIKDLRHKIFAHNGILSDEEREAIYQSVNKNDITNLIQILLNILYALQEAELNGRKPDFSFDYTYPIKQAEREIEGLITSLT